MSYASVVMVTFLNSIKLLIFEIYSGELYPTFFAYKHIAMLNSSLNHDKIIMTNILYLPIVNATAVFYRQGSNQHIFCHLRHAF